MSNILFEGYVKERGTEKPIVGAMVVLEGERVQENITHTDIEGFFRNIVNVEGTGRRNIVISKTNYDEKIISIDISIPRHDLGTIYLETEIRVVGTVLEQNTNLPIQAAEVKMKDKTVKTNAQGIFTIAITNVELPQRLEISKKGYRKKEVEITGRDEIIQVLLEKGEENIFITLKDLITKYWIWIVILIIIIIIIVVIWKLRIKR